jgi:curved DNA-binding protein CbpA
MNRSADTPFSVLGIAPTGDLAAVKRAYFAALAKHPPHSDPEGFQRLRAAYEPLSSPEGLRAAFARVPPDVPAELARYRARHDDLLAAGAAAWTEGAAAAELGLRFKRAVMGMTLAEALSAFGPAVTS